MKKRILATVLSLVLALMLAACGGSSSSSTSAASSAQKSEAAPAASSAASEAASEASSAASEAASEASSAASEAASAEASSEADSTSEASEPAEAEAVEPYQFNISYGGTPSSSMVAVMTKLQEIMAEESGGAFTFNAFNDNSYKETQALDELMNDVVDIVYLNSASTSATISELAYLGMPGCFRYTDDPDAFKNFESSIHDLMSDIYANYGIHYLGLRVPARMAIVGTGDVVTKAEDLQGKVVRAASWQGKLCAAMGIATQNISLSELATALQRHTIDSCFTGIEQVYSQMLGEVVDYASILPETDGIGSLVIDADCWDKLTDAQKACIERSVEKWMDGCLEVSTEFYKTAVAHLEEYKVNIHNFTDEECDAFLYAVPTVYEEIDASTSELGIKLKEAILAYRAG